MKKIWTLFIMVIGFASQGLYAQSLASKVPVTDKTQSVAESAKTATDQLNATVQLSQAQYTDVYNYFYKVLLRCVEAPARTGSHSLEQTQASLNYFGPRNTGFFKERDDKLKSILTPEQWQKAQDTGAAQLQPAGKE
jgi:hypothetical protein